MDGVTNMTLFLHSQNRVGDDDVIYFSFLREFKSMVAFMRR